MKQIFLFILLAMLFTGCIKSQVTPLSQPTGDINNQLVQSVNSVAYTRVSFLTDDGVSIVGTVKEAGAPQKFLLLLHMLPSTRESWYAFSGQAASQGFSSLAIDLRGHGESITQRDKLRMLNQKLDYIDFTDVEHQATIRDVEAALDYLQKEKGVKLENIILVGASIGANLALQALAGHPEIPAAVLLSPGLNYHGIKIKPLAEKISRDQAVLLLTSTDDAYSFQTNKALYGALKTLKKQNRWLEKAGHGTQILENQPETVETIIRWIKSLTSPLAP